MGVGLLFGLVFLLVFLVTGIILFIYSKRRNSKIGLILSSIMIGLSIVILLTNKIDEWTITKKDVVSDLKHLNIEIKDDFKITKNKVLGMPERIQETEIRISERDKNLIKKEIIYSANFKAFANEQELIDDADTKQFSANKKIFNFKYPEFSSRETYTKIDNYPTRLFLSLYDKTNTIKYQRIEK